TFQEQFNSSFTQLHQQGKQFINLNLRELLIKENQYFGYLFDSTHSKTNSKKNKLIESCLRSMWSCVLSKPSLKPYPLKFASNLQLNREIQSKNIKIAKEFLGNNDDCDSIGYFIWPSLIRCDTNDNIKPNHQITPKDQKGAKTEQVETLENWIKQYDMIREISISLAEQLKEKDVAKRQRNYWCYYVLFCIADSAYEVAYGEVIDKKNIKNVPENIKDLVLQKARFNISTIQQTKLKSI
ncbi:hypothetical protein RFI_25401, partial [Reticulomyxa filosa]